MIDPAADGTVARRTRRKVAWRILPFIFLVYIVAYLDRANVGFAKLAMKDDLKFSDDVFGFGFGIFFIGYLVAGFAGAVVAALATFLPCYLLTHSHFEHISLGSK